MGKSSLSKSVLKPKVLVFLDAISSIISSQKEYISGKRNNTKVYPHFHKKHYLWKYFHIERVAL